MFLSKLKVLIICLFYLVGFKNFAQENIITQSQMDSIFTANKVNGTLVLYDLKNQKNYVHNKKRANKGFLPASTFKIPNSLIGLETKAVKDENEIIKWDGVERSFESWNRDHSMKTAIKVSCVPFYQEIARRIGKTQMQQWINKINYGNKNISEKIDDFWLVGNLRITAFEQIDFLKNLYANKLPFSENTLKVVKEILILEETEKYILRGKTGWATKEKVGWWVGYLETGNNVYFLAMNIDMPDESYIFKRLFITNSVYKTAKLK